MSVATDNGNCHNKLEMLHLVEIADPKSDDSIFIICLITFEVNYLLYNDHG